MVLHLADQLDVPLRERNALLMAGGFAPTFHATDFAAPEMQPVRDAVERVLAAHEPYPGDPRRPAMEPRRREPRRGRAGRRRGARAARSAVQRAARDAAPERLAPRILNLDEWTEHILGNLRRQVAVTGDDELRELDRRARGLRGGDGRRDPPPHEAPRAIAMPMRLRTDDGELAFITMIATFGTALDITLTELALETFLPADASTAAALHRRFGGPG